MCEFSGQREQVTAPALEYSVKLQAIQSADVLARIPGICTIVPVRIVSTSNQLRQQVRNEFAGRSRRPAAERVPDVRDVERHGATSRRKSRHQRSVGKLLRVPSFRRRDR